MKPIQKIIKHLIKSPKIAIFHHVNPDGDSLSCSYGLLLALKLKFPKKEIVLVGDESSMKKSFKFLNINFKFFKSQIDDSYLAIVGDTSVSQRIEKYDEFKKAKIKLCFDHHQTPSDINFDSFWQEPSYPASAMQAIEITKNLKIKLTEDASLFLAIGLLTDTNNFTFSLANPLPPLYYSELLRNISEKTMNNFFNSLRKRSLEEVEIQAMILNNIKFLGNVAYVVFDKDTVEKYPDIQQKNMVNLIGNIEHYPIWAMFTYSEDKVNKQPIWNINLRSNGPKVSEVAVFFGGGGHHRAAGARIPVTVAIIEVIKKLNKLPNI